MDLGEPMQYVFNTAVASAPLNNIVYPSNEANELYNKMNAQYSAIRDITQLSSQLSGLSSLYGYEISQDYEKLERARLLDENDYTKKKSLIEIENKHGKTRKRRFSDFVRRAHYF